jgi:hypothetical protein
MAIKQWIGGAQAVKQTSTITIGGTAATSDTFKVTVGYASITYTVSGTTDSATIAAGLLALINATDAPSEYRDAVWSVSTNVITAVSAVAGVPFDISVSKVSVSGTIGTSTAIAATGPNYLDDAANWSGGTLPSTSDTLVFEGSVSALYGFSEEGPFAEIQVPASYQGNIGLSAVNVRGYREYRPTHCPWKTDKLIIGSGTGRGSAMLKFDTLDAESDVVILSTGRSNRQDEAPLQLVGEMNSVIASSGTIDLAGNALQSATVDTLTIGSAATIEVGPQVTLDTVHCGGVAEINSDCATLNVRGGRCNLAAAAPQIDITGGELVYSSDAAITQAKVGPGILNCNDLRTRNCTTLRLRGGGRIVDPLKTLTITTIVFETGVREVSAI